MIRIGVDLGGTKTEAIALSPAGDVLSRQRVATPRDDYVSTVRTVATLVAEIEREIGAQGSVGVGTPGAVSSRTGRMKNCNSVWLNGRPLKQDLEDAIGREIRIANDANCFALSEAVDGAAAGAAVVFGVILGTGVGGGIVVDGRVLEGANAVAGEWGHNPLPAPQDDERLGPACYCGRSGCIETFLSGPGLARDHAARTGRSLETPEIAAGAASGDARCEATLARYEDRLARALAHVVNIVDPDVIVLGGGLSNLERLYVRVPEIWSRHIFSDTVATRLERARHGDSSGVRGAAWLWSAPALS